ncbi:U4/U6.U5 tri-snRNP-associated protein 1, putative [Plasmodium gaboni]|uniref:U4/U6.U5 tri-snRNP-associated protein 1, putative n=1 Tax=Plasmodium gaboni TaxID=647221 RepID=A0ABY1UHQ0_9APIC|nr:U4/U6.U5 tri-snRNP-associated protein 1, putative [Plasmodium gaboni]
MDDKVCELSIEETNKLREKLGLKKLNITKDNDKKNENHDDEKGGKNRRKNSSNNKTKQIEKEEGFEEHVRDTKKKKQKINTISEDYKDDINDVEAWINKTRNSMNQRLEKHDEIKYSDDENEEQSYNKKNKKRKKKNSNDNENFVSKVKVEHKNEDITEDMILTLKDQNILSSDQEDCLINEELKKQNMKSLLSKKDDNYWTQNYYDPLSYYDDNNNNNNNNIDDNSSIQMLPKYKDEKHSFDVSVTYEKTQTKYKHEKDIEKKKKKNEYKNENKSVNKKQSHETNHMVQLKKRKIKNINKRKKEEDAWDFLYNDNTEEDNQESDTTNKNNETKKKEKILQQKRDEQDEKDEHEQNVDILNDVINKIKEEQMDMDINYFDNPFSDNEDDKELYELLEKGSNLQKRKKEKNYENELLKYIVINEDEKSQKNKNNDNNKDNDNDHSDDDDNNNNNDNDYNSNNVIKLTNTSEFCKNISLPLDVLENEKKVKSKKKSANAQDVDIHLNDEYNSSNKNILEENINEDILKNTILENEDDYNDDNSSELHGVSEIFNEVKLDEGLFGALEYLKTKGELNMEDKIYRNPENKPLHMSTDKDDIKLDYKNEFGKVMTPKESFRYISWIFHGKKQGKNKLEKKIKRLEIERRFKENPIDSLPTLNVLKKYQQMQKKSYFTLSNNN